MMRIFILLGIGIASTSCATFRPGISEISSFRSDACSMFPEGTFGNGDLWEECCVEHDIAYWQGGTVADRLAADERLRECVEQKTGNRVLARMMYDGVRAGGSPSFPTWYRWAYGWPSGRPYGPLSEAERRQVTDKLEGYHGSRAMP